MDVSLPGMSGIEATRKIAEEQPGIRIVALSMHDSQDVADRMMHAGAAAYVTKADAVSSLVDTLLRVTS